MNQKSKYTLLLEHCKNPDIDDAQRRGYWSPPISPRKMKVECNSLPEAKKKFVDWIERNGLGGGNLTRACGNLLDGKILVGQFSYNGKLWHPKGHEVIIEEAAPAPEVEDEDEVTGNLLVPKALWGTLCCLAEAVAWSAEPLVDRVDEARGICANIDAYYGAPTPGKYPRLEGATA